MEPLSATELIDTLVYKPDWKFDATISDRYEGAVQVRVAYPAKRFNRADAPDYTTDLDAVASVTILCGDCPDDTSLYRKLIDFLLTIEEHESREALRVRPTMWAPFHPHRQDGIKRWGSPARDLTFGVA
jgi:hypothetical protein